MNVNEGRPFPAQRSLLHFRSGTKSLPRFFFDTDDGDQSHRDDEGHDLPDVQAARVAALDALPDMARDKMPDGDRRTFVAAVRDDRGTVVYVATLSLKGEWRTTP